MSNKEEATNKIKEGFFLTLAISYRVVDQNKIGQSVTLDSFTIQKFV
jgi:hypothetical protein